MIAEHAEKEKMIWGKNDWLVFVGVLMITGVVFSGCLRLEWTNWDDDVLVYGNTLVQNFNLKDILTRPTEYNTYNPLVLLTFALEWKLVGGHPLLYHLNNFLLHLACTALALLFFRRLGVSVWWSGFGALLFGIHPLKVESVAWIAERKDCLFGLFFLASLLAYLAYLASDKKTHLLFSFVFFLAALLSKGQAIALPFVLILLDGYFQRPLNLKILLEKAVFFAASLMFAVLTITFFVKEVRAPADQRTIVCLFNTFEQVLLGGYAYSVYILKSFIPYATSPLYPMPTSLRLEHWLGGAAALGVFAGALVIGRKYRFIAFGILFFTLNIFFFLMPFRMSEKAFLFDHYSYMATLGVFFLMAMGLQHLSRKSPLLRSIAFCTAAVLLMIDGALTVRYLPAWKNSETLWTYVIEKYPLQVAWAYVNRGDHRQRVGQISAASMDFDRAVAVNPENAAAYFRRSMLHLQQNHFEQALRDYNRYKDLVCPDDKTNGNRPCGASEVYNDRGVIYYRMGRYDKALDDFNASIESGPLNADPYCNRALAYFHLNQYGKAIEDFNLCQTAGPLKADLINIRGVCYLRLGHFRSALEDFTRAIALNSANPSYFANRAIVWHRLGYPIQAKQDAQAAENLSAPKERVIRKQSSIDSRQKNKFPIGFF